LGSGAGGSGGDGSDGDGDDDDDDGPMCENYVSPATAAATLVVFAIELTKL